MTEHHIQSPDVLVQQVGRMGFITLARPKALNALSLGMIRSITRALLAWREDPLVLGVAVRGQSKEGDFGAFCAGGDIRFFHQAASTSAWAELDAFFTEEYALNHLIHTYPKPYVAFMDGVVMGGGMGISQGGTVRMVTERTRMAMPETAIGLFPDVGGGYFLSRCPGRVGEYLGMTGQVIGSRTAIAWGLADGHVDALQLPGIWQTLQSTPFESAAAIEHWLGTRFMPEREVDVALRHQRTIIDQCFSQEHPVAILAALEAVGDSWASDCAATLKQRSPLMLAVTLQHIRRARHLSLAEDLRLERDMIWHCLRPTRSRANESVCEGLEGIRALVIDKDHQPHWQHRSVADVQAHEVERFFQSPWAESDHPLAQL